jgi:hypothetical protein
MLQKIVENLINQEETVWLEFKAEWYWSNEESRLSKAWGEFLKDFSALFNTHSKQQEDDRKYLIIGFHEADRKLKEFDIDKNGQKLGCFEDLRKFKEKVISKLKHFFINTPEYKGSTNLIQIESLFDVTPVVIKSCRLLVFTFHAAPYLLEVKELLQGNESFRNGNIIIRRLKKDGTPENSNANFETVEALKTSVKLKQERDYPNKDTSIKKVVQAFKEKFSPASEILEVKIERNHISGIYFEIFTIKGEYFATTTFLYFSKYTSQNKTVDYIVENSLLGDSSNKIILTDTFNKSGGKIDKDRIQQLLNDRGFNIQIYYLEDFALKKLYEDLFDPQIFHQGNFNIDDFVKPYTSESDEKTADILLAEWYESPRKPLIVMKGMGGIGKTTVIKYFLDELHSRSENVNILFINSHEIINDIMKSSRIESIYDFYKIVAEKVEETKKFDEKLLELSIDNGNLIIVLDGIDEVIAKVGSKFNIGIFIDSIFKNYSENLEKAKVLITCRDYFWDDSLQKHHMDKISLKPFSKDLAEKYFRNHFDDENKVKKAMSLADEYAFSGDEKIYIPYILDMIKDDLLIASKNRGIKSKILKVEEDTNDYLVGKVCEREIVKLDNLEIDYQIKFFIHMAFAFNGTIHKSHLKKLQSTLGTEFTNTQIDKFNDHPLLIFDKVNNILSFRFDFFNEYFKSIGLSAFLIEGDFSKIDHDITDVMTQYISYENSFTKSIKKRLGKDISDTLKSSILKFFLEDIDTLDAISTENKHKLSSSLFILLMVLTGVDNTEERTSLLKEFYEYEVGVIKKLCIINLHASSGKVLFDFRGLKFEDCVFENYEYFSACKFDSNTYFANTKFIAPLHMKGVTPRIGEANIDKYSCDITGIIDVISEIEQVYESEEASLRKDLKQIIKFFWQGSAFKQKLASGANKKLRSHSHIVDCLIEKGVIETTTVTTKQKRADKAYFISPLYSNLRKVMEENETCLEFEEIVNFLQNDC